MGKFQPFAHVGFIFALAVLIFAAAYGLVFLEQIAAQAGSPRWFLFGMQAVSIGLFIFDAILLLGASGITIIKLLIGRWKGQD